MDQPGWAILANSIHSMTSLLTVPPLFAWLMQPRKTDEPKEDGGKACASTRASKRASGFELCHSFCSCFCLLVRPSVRPEQTRWQLSAASHLQTIPPGEGMTERPFDDTHDTDRHNYGKESIRTPNTNSGLGRVDGKFVKYSRRPYSTSNVVYVSVTVSRTKLQEDHHRCHSQVQVRQAGKMIIGKS